MGCSAQHSCPRYSPSWGQQGSRGDGVGSRSYGQRLMAALCFLPCAEGAESSPAPRGGLSRGTPAPLPQQ